MKRQTIFLPGIFTPTHPNSRATGGHSVSLMRFLLLLLLLGALLVGALLVLLYGYLPYSTLGPALESANHAARLANIPWPARQLAHTATSYLWLRGLAYAVLGLGALGLAYCQGAARRAYRLLIRDAGRAARALGQTWRHSSPVGKMGAQVGLLVVVAVRAYYLLHAPFNNDELITTDYFVAPGPAVAAGFYLLPNNHVLSSLLVWPLFHLYAAGAPDLLMRLPVFGLCVVGLVVGFAVLAHFTSLRVAFFATLLFQLSPMAVEYATTARGYGLQTLCVQATMLATVVLLRGPSYYRLAWVVWVGASVAGFYLIPTFLYPFAGIGAAILLVAPRRMATPLRWQWLVAAAGVSGLVALLYLPVAWLSGWNLLLANPYVAQMDPANFWRNLPSYYIPTLLTNLYGRTALGWPVLGLLILAPVVLVRWASSSLKLAGWVVWLGILAPVPLLLAQRVMPPARTLHYTFWMALVLAGIVVEVAASRMRKRVLVMWVAACMVGSSYTLVRLAQLSRALQTSREYDDECRAVEQWLRDKHPRSILTTVPAYDLYLVHKAVAAGRPRPAVQNHALRYFNDTPLLWNYDYLVLSPDERLPARLAPRHYQTAFCTKHLWVYQYQPNPYHSLTARP